MYFNSLLCNVPVFTFLEKKLVRACIVKLLRASQNHAERIFGAYLERDNLAGG